MLRARQQGLQGNLIDQQTRRIDPAITAIVPMHNFYSFTHVRANIVNARRNDVNVHRLSLVPVSARKGRLLRKTGKTYNVRFRPKPAV